MIYNVTIYYFAKVKAKDEEQAEHNAKVLYGIDKPKLEDLHVLVEKEE